MLPSKRQIEHRTNSLSAFRSRVVGVHLVGPVVVCGFIIRIVRIFHIRPLVGRFCHAVLTSFSLCDVCRFARVTLISCVFPFPLWAHSDKIPRSTIPNAVFSNRRPISDWVRQQIYWSHNICADSLIFGEDRIFCR